MSSSATTPSTGFDHFKLHEDLERGIRAAGFESPRPIQLETIPAGLEGRDILGLAQTGTGKTAAFSLPLLDYLLEDRLKGPRALVVAPTRELATQIADEMKMLAQYTHLKIVTIFGGVSMQKQIQALRGNVDVVVGCPGRLLDLVGQKKLRLDRVEALVLDEADHMFDMGFLPDIRRIVKALPRDRQNLLFSATMPREIRGLADDLLYDPHVVELSHTAPASTIDHALYPVAEGRKRDLLEHLLNREDCDSAIVFTRTKHRARRLAQQLEKAGHRAVGLQGNLSQNARDRAMNGFRGGRYDILVATDIVARGIDVSGVSYVINFDVPNTAEAYTHRIGRTGRSEREGVACTFITGDDSAWVKATERMIGDKIPRKRVDGFDARADERAERVEQGRARRAGDGGNGGNGDGRRKRPTSKTGGRRRRSRGGARKSASSANGSTRRPQGR